MAAHSTRSSPDRAEDTRELHEAEEWRSENKGKSDVNPSTSPCSCGTAEYSPWPSRILTRSIVLGHAGWRSSTARVNTLSGTRLLMVALGDSGVQFVYRRQRPTSRRLICWSETMHFVATTTWPPEEQLRDATTTRIVSCGGLRMIMKVCRLLCMRKKVC